MNYSIRKPNRTHRSNKKRIVSKFRDFENFDDFKKQSKAQRKLKKKYSRIAKQREKEELQMFMQQL